MKIILFTIIYLGLLLNCLSQSMGYILTNDSTYLIGLITLENSNPKQVIYKSSFDGEPQYYTAQQLLEFGYLKGDSYKLIDRKFLAVDIEVDGRNQKEFAQLLVYGKIKLYKIDKKKNIYLLEDQSRIQLNNGNFEEIIKKFAGSCNVGDSNKFYVKHNFRSLFRFVRSLNEGKCYHYTGSVLGVFFGYNLAKVNLFRNSFIENTLADFSTNAGNIKFGLNFDTPLLIDDNLSLIGQVTFDKYNFNHDGIRILINNSDPLLNIGILQHLELDLSFLGFELLPKYSYRVKQFSFFIMTGLASSVLLNKKNLLRKEVTQAGSFTFTSENTDFITLSNIHLGYALGIGSQYFYKPGKYVALELKNSKLFNFKVNRKILNINNNYITLKTNF